jgi:surfactin synthase thioesterase subunit
LANAELLALVLPTLRADFEACETYVPIPGPALSCPLSVFSGTQDASVEDEAVRAWGRYSQGAVAMQMFEGGHFFIQEHGRAVLDAVARALAHP